MGRTDQSVTASEHSSAETQFERVFRASDDILYLTGGSNSAATLYTEAGFRQRINSVAWKKLFEARNFEMSRLGSRFAQLIVPEKLTIYPLVAADMDRLFPGTAPEDIVPPGRRLIREAELDEILYPDDFLREQSLRFPVYLRTDSHWTWEGAFSAFQAMMWRLGYKPNYEAFVRLPRNTLRYHGDLWDPSMAGLDPDQIVRISLPPSIKRIYLNPIVGFKENAGLDDEAGLHMGSHCIFQNRGAQFEETVILFGSSFSEYRLEPSLLTAIFSYFFNTVHFVWSTAVDTEYVARHRPQLTVAEIPERFLTFFPQNSWSVEEFSVDKLRAWKKEHPRTPSDGHAVTLSGGATGV